MLGVFAGEGEGGGGERSDGGGEDKACGVGPGDGEGAAEEQDAAAAGCWHTPQGPASLKAGPLAAESRREEVRAGGERLAALLAGRKAARRQKIAGRRRRLRGRRRTALGGRRGEELVLLVLVLLRGPPSDHAGPVERCRRCGLEPGSWLPLWSAQTSHLSADGH